MTENADLRASMFGWQGNADQMNAKTFDNQAEPAAGPAMAQRSSADPDICRSSVADLTIEDFVSLIGDITGQLDLLNATVALAGAVEVEHGLAMIASEVRTLAGQVRQVADGIAAAVAASGSISGEVATAFAGIKDAICRINELMANASAADMMNRSSLQAFPLSRLPN